MPVDGTSQQSIVELEQRYLELVDSTQKHLELLSTETSSLKVNNADQAAQIANLEGEIEKQIQECIAIKQERDSLRSQCIKLEKTITDLEFQNAIDKDKALELAKANGKLSDRILALEEACLEEAKHRSDAGRKNELLLQQLYQVQEELVNYFYECRKRDSQLADRESRITWLREQRNCLKSLIRKQRCMINRCHATHSRIVASVGFQ